jgi:flagellar biogenesis protein FliO
LIAALLAGGALGIFAGPGLAAESDNRLISPAGGNTGTGLADKSWLAGWPQVVGALALVAGLVFLAGYCLKRGSQRGQLSRGKNVFEVVSRGQVSMKHQVYLVQVGRRLLVLGSGSTGLSTLAEITDPQEAMELVELAQGAKSQTFRNLLESKAEAFQAGGLKEAGLAGRNNSKGKTQELHEDSYEAVRQLKEKLLARLGEENQDKHD